MNARRTSPRYLPLSEPTLHAREEFDALKKQGIIVGAHIPMGPSGLALDRSAIDAFGVFAASLLDAAELARANREAGLRRSGNLPWDT